MARTIQKIWQRKHDETFIAFLFLAITKKGTRKWILQKEMRNHNHKPRTPYQLDDNMKNP
jgi:hypothetical protein